MAGASPEVTGQAGMRWLLLATMAAWGLNLPVMKLLLPVFGALGTSTLRMLAACLLLSALTWSARRAWPRLSPRQWAALAVCGAVMVYANQVLLMAGMRRTSATHAALIMALNPLLSSLLAAAALGVPLAGARLWGVALGFGGVALVILQQQVGQGGAAMGHSGLGDLLVLGAIVTWVAGGVMVQRLADPRSGGALDSGSVTWAVNLIGTALLVLHWVVEGEPLVQPGATVTAGLVVMLVLSGLLATAAGALVWNRALSTLGVAHASLYIYWVPIFGVAFSVLLLGEALTRWHLIGLVAVLAGTWLGTRGAVRPVVQAGE